VKKAKGKAISTPPFSRLFLLWEKNYYPSLNQLRFMKNYLSFLLFLFSVGILACKKENVSTFLNSGSGNVNIYATGVGNSHGAPSLNYWKNGSPVTLPSQSKLIFHAETTSGIVVSGNDVYVCGTDYNDAAEFFVATYWKNGSRFALGNTSGDSYANSIAVSGTDVYVAGYQNWADKYTITWHAYATYWKNGSPVTLGDTSSESIANSIFVSGNDVYVVGTRTSLYGGYTAIPIVVYWKNGKQVDLADTSVNGDATSILVSGSDIYPAWVELNSSNNQELYGTNGMAIPLQGTSNPYNVTSMVASGNDIYASGNLLEDQYSNGIYTPYQASYWKNGNLVKLSDGSGSSSAASIAVSGNDVYVGGVNNSEGVIWKNGVPATLPGSIYITSIFLTNK
jgi:hypothetical protein